MNQIPQEKIDEVMQFVANTEMDVLVKTLKAKNFSFKSEKALSRFVRNNLIKTTTKDTITYHYKEYGTGVLHFLFSMTKEIVLDGDVFKLNLNIDNGEQSNQTN
jgi:hypothetical protein